MPVFAKYPELAKTLDNNNMNVMNSKVAKIIELEEMSVSLSRKFITFKSYKLPLLNESGQVIGLLGISCNVTKYKSELKELHDRFTQNELALDNIMANLPGHVYWTNKKNQFLGCNDQQAYDFGLMSRHDIVGLAATAFQTPENAEVIKKNNIEVIKSGNIMTTEEHFKDVNGLNRIYLSKKTPLKNKAGETVGLLGISFDITDKVEAEQLRSEIEKHRAIEAEQKKFRSFIDKIQKYIQSYRLETLNDQLGNNTKVSEIDKKIELTQRERQVLYYTSLHKSPKDIAKIVTILEGKTVAPATIQAVINKQLYVKFDVYSIGQLIETATSLELIPAIL